MRPSASLLSLHDAIAGICQARAVRALEGFNYLIPSSPPASRSSASGSPTSR